jgi:hypothetical protein
LRLRRAHSAELLQERQKWWQLEGLHEAAFAEKKQDLALIEKLPEQPDRIKGVLLNLNTVDIRSDGEILYQGLQRVEPFGLVPGARVIVEDDHFRVGSMEVMTADFSAHVTGYADAPFLAGNMVNPVVFPRR